MAGPFRLGFAGDVMLGRLVDDVQRRRPVEAVWGDLLDRLRSLDGLFVNLECCLSARGEPWTRTPRTFHFRADPDWAVPALRRAGVDWVALANNHVLDYGEAALDDTLSHLSTADIAHAGAGRSIAEAREPARLTVADLSIALVAFTDHPVEYAAGPDSPGTAHVDPSGDPEAAREVVGAALDAAGAADPDLLVASMHLGPNMVEEPSEPLRAFARWLAERGADLVHSHSAHVFQGVEVHEGSPILHDAGDFVDDYAVDPALRNDRSFLFELHVGDGGELRELRLVPTEIDEYAIDGASPEAAEWSRRRMRALSEPYGTTFDRDDGALVLTL